MKTIAVLTSGGDAPGMNAAIRAATRTAIARGLRVIGVRAGFAGLISGDYSELTSRDVSGIIELGGTMLESARCPEFKTPEGIAKAETSLRNAGIDGVIVIGGNGSQTGAFALHKAGIPVNGVASTIDNDLVGSDVTIGADTAVNISLEAIDRLRTTASSHHRLFIIEVMGRDCGYLALAAGIAGGAEVIVTPEHVIPIETVVGMVRNAHSVGKKHFVVVVAEGVKDYAAELHNTLCRDPDTLFDPRLTILGHVQRGGRPTAFDRLLATRMACRATDLLIDGYVGNLIGLKHGAAEPTPLKEVVGLIKPLPEELLRIADHMNL